MKTEPPNESDSPLGALLNEWKTEHSFAPGFQERVWRRIDQVNRSQHKRNWLGRWLETLQTRPALAAGYVTALLALGFTLGWAQGLERGARVEQALELRYVQVVDPFQHANP